MVKSSSITKVYPILLWLPGAVTEEPHGYVNAPHLHIQPRSFGWRDILDKADEVSGCIVVTDEMALKLTVLASVKFQNIFDFHM